MTAINLALRNLYGHVLHGNSLTGKPRLAYRTGFNGRGFIREIPLNDVPPAVQEAVHDPSPEAPPPRLGPPLPSEPPSRRQPGPPSQLKLF